MVVGGLAGLGLCHWWEVKAATTITTTEDARLLGIDVSKYQGTINWKKVKADGVDYAILRCGFGQDLTNQDDPTWKTNADACTSYGIPFGTYIYSYATTEAAAVGEAKHVLRLIKDYDMQYPVYYDMEHTTQMALSASKLGKIAKAFCDEIEKAGYKVGIYSSYNYFTNKLTDPIFDNYDRWVARYNSYCKYSKSYNMWQFTSSGTVDGISGNVDMDYTIGTEVVSKVSGISLSSTKCTLKVGENQTLTATVQPLNAYNKSVSWSSSDKNVVSVSAGKLLAVGEGNATVTVKSKETSSILATCQVTVGAADTVVTPDPTDSIVVTPTPTSVVVVTEPPINADVSTGTGIEVTSAPSVTASVGPIQTQAASMQPTMSPVTATPNSTDAVTETPVLTASPTVQVTETPVATVSPTAKVTVTPAPTVSVGSTSSFSYKAVSKSQISLTWNAVKNADGYRIYYYDSTSKKYVSFVTLSSSTLTYSVKNLGKKALSAGTNYKFKIKAYRVVDGKKYWGSAESLTATTKPATVKIKKVTRNTSRKATVKWNAVSGAQGYVVYISTSKTGTYRVVATVVGKSKTSYTIKGLSKGKGYYVRVCAYKKLNKKTWYGNYYATKYIVKK